MKKHATTILLSAALLLGVGCAQGEKPMTDRTMMPCADKPNCVSTIDNREDFNIKPFVLASDAVLLSEIRDIALTLPGARLGQESNGYMRIECVSKIMRFVDDLELRIDEEQLIVRSESRVGYSDFGVNRKRVEQLREALSSAGLIR